MLESVNHELLLMFYGLVVGTRDFLGVHDAYRVAVPPHRSFWGILSCARLLFLRHFLKAAVSLGD